MSDQVLPDQVIIFPGKIGHVCKIRKVKLCFFVQSSGVPAVVGQAWGTALGVVDKLTDFASQFVPKVERSKVRRGCASGNVSLLYTNCSIYAWTA